jgi:hypothetical protein
MCWLANGDRLFSYLLLISTIASPCLIRSNAADKVGTGQLERDRRIWGFFVGIK